MDRQFLVIKTKQGLDDLGFSGSTFLTDEFTKGDVVKIDNRLKTIIDKTGCSNNPSDLIKEGIIKEFLTDVNGNHVFEGDEVILTIDGLGEGKCTIINTNDGLSFSNPTNGLLSIDEYSNRNDMSFKLINT